MRTVRFVIISLLICSPVVASAQRTRGTTRENWDRLEQSGRGAAAPALSRRDVAGMEPVARLIGARKSLKLTEAQLALLKSLEAASNARDESLLHAVDSLKSELRPSGQMNDETRLRMQGTREELIRVVGALRFNYARSANEALPLLDDTQRAPAEALLQKQRAEADEMLQEKLAGGRSAGSPPPGRGGPPRRPPTN